MAALYRQIKAQLIADIAAGRIPPGGVLPNETELARRFEVSIGTLRRAVDELVAEHILVRQQGRGTFVGKLDRDRFMFQFFKIAGRDGRREFPQVRLLAFAKGKATAPDAAALGLAVGAPVWRVENLLSLQGRPVIHDHLVLPAALYPGLTRALFAGRPATIYELYQTEFGVTVVDTDERVRADAADASSAALLGLPEGAPVLRIERTALSFGQQPAEWRISVVDTRQHDYWARAREST